MSDFIDKTHKYLNLGCGTRFHPDWVNVDFVSDKSGVLTHDLRLGVPFPDNTFEVVYHSHVLEHFSKAAGEDFIRECYRVLKPGGIIRVVVPDLETIGKEYLKNLESALTHGPAAEADYDWSMLELYDQTVRNVSGGDMVKYWQRTVIPNENYVASRMGHEFVSYRKQMKGNTFLAHGTASPLWERFFNWGTYKNRILIWLYGDKDLFKYISVGKFRLGGEVHQWMYDRFSLGRLLRNSGFKECRQVNATDSNIPNWETYQWLDFEGGKIRKPDSLFMESVK